MGDQNVTADATPGKSLKEHREQSPCVRKGTGDFELFYSLQNKQGIWYAEPRMLLLEGIFHLVLRADCPVSCGAHTLPLDI